MPLSLASASNCRKPCQCWRETRGGVGAKRGAALARNEGRRWRQVASASGRACALGDARGGAQECGGWACARA
eukprot:6198493-Pleurochrysis_carterae.AAC.1